MAHKMAMMTTHHHDSSSSFKDDIAKTLKIQNEYTTWNNFVNFISLGKYFLPVIFFDNTGLIHMKTVPKFSVPFFISLLARFKNSLTDQSFPEELSRMFGRPSHFSPKATATLLISQFLAMFTKKTRVAFT